MTVEVLHFLADFLLSAGMVKVQAPLVEVVESIDEFLGAELLGVLLDF